MIRNTRPRALLAGLATAGLLVAGAAAPASAADAVQRGITVTASGVVKATPDAAKLSFSISILSATSAIALDTTNSLQKQARSLVLAKGIDAKDIQTTGISIYPEYQYSDKAPVLTGYRASQSTTVTGYAIPRVAELIDGLAGLSSDIQINSLSLFVSNPEKYEQRARLAAVNKARTKALSYAKALGRKLRAAQYVNETSAPVTPVYNMDFAKGEATVIDPGQQNVSVTIEVRFALR